MQQTHYQLFHLIHYMILIINLTDQILTWIKNTIFHSIPVR